MTYRLFSSQRVKKNCLVFLLCFLVPIFPSAKKSAPAVLEELKTSLSKASRAIDKKDERSIDFYLSRAMGLISNASDLGEYWKETNDLLKKAGLGMSVQAPYAFSKSFTEYLLETPATLWGCPPAGVDEAGKRMCITLVSDGKSALNIVASPMLERWGMFGGEGKKFFADLPECSTEEPPFIAYTKLEDGKPAGKGERLVLDLKGMALLHLWPVDFFDLDGDGAKEVLIRCNAAAHNGFTQFLLIYKPSGDSLKLVARLEGGGEGLARRVKGKIFEVGAGVPSGKDNDGGPAQIRLDTIKYEGGKFVKVSQKKIPNPVLGEDWKKFYEPPEDAKTGQ